MYKCIRYMKVIDVKNEHNSFVISFYRRSGSRNVTAQVGNPDTRLNEGGVLTEIQWVCLHLSAFSNNPNLTLLTFLNYFIRVETYIPIKYLEP